MAIIMEVAKIIDEQYLDYLLKPLHKPILVLDTFSCYMANFDQQFLQKVFPEYKDILKNVHIKFIILAKKLYNTAMELFCSINDLTSTNLHTFLNLANTCGIKVQYAQGLYTLFKDYSIILLEKNALHELRNTVNKFVEMERLKWEKTINKSTNIVISSFDKE